MPLENFSGGVSVCVQSKALVMDKNDRKFLIWFLIAMAIAILPWFII